MIDGTEAAILTRLQANAREKRKAIAADLKLTESSLSKRIKTLEKAGIIRKYTIDLDHVQLGLTVTALTFVKEKDSSSTKFDAALDICKLGEARMVHRITGDWDIAIIWMCRDTAHLSETLEHVYRHQNVERTNTTILMKELKKENGAPITTTPSAK